MVTELPVTDEIVDFSSPRRSLKFRIDDDVFEAAPDIAADAALRFADEAERLDADGVTADEQIAIVHKLFRTVLLPESADRFIARLNDVERPIGPRKFGDVVRWLFEEYGLRPTESDSPSSGGSASPASGTSSTASTSGAASTSPDSVSLAS